MRYSTLHSCLLKAPTAKQMNDAAEHLRYWPYVKAYRKLGEKSVEVIFLIGSFSTRTQQSHYLSRSRELVLLCLRQYGVQMGRWFEEEEFAPDYSDGLYLRPDDKLKPFSTFIHEVEQERKSIPF